MRVATVIGIRPDFIRMSKMIRLLDASGLEHVLIHAGQHYSFRVDGVFFEELGIRPPDYNLGVGSGSHGDQVGRLLAETGTVLRKVRPDLVVVLGDSNTSLAAIEAAKSNIRVAHIEAGMRSYDWRMPEEKNRTIVDHIADYLYVYTPRYRENLLQEGLPADRIVVIGNPIVDVVEECLPLARRRSCLGTLGLRPRGYVLATVHRAENVDAPETLAGILRGLEMVGERVRAPVVFPMYYRTQHRVRQMGITMPRNITTLDPLGFLDFLQLEADALCLLTDSGTVQEEGCILRVPCVTMRLSTERPETVEVGANILSGVDPAHICEAALRMVEAPRTWDNPLGDGTASERAVRDILARQDRILDRTVPLPFADPRKRACFAPHLGPEDRLAFPPVWAPDPPEES
jgi:UDP-N-acetylglucosamine 2-epimerase (non-hydrolysing)